LIAARCSHRLHSGVGQQRLHLLNQNHSRAPHVDGLAYAYTEILRVPSKRKSIAAMGRSYRACWYP